MSERRIVVYPQGFPSGSEHRSWCEELVVHCGGDLQRCISAPGPSLADFLRHARRLAALQNSRNRALVVMTRSRPLQLLVPARQRLESDCPVLASALWTLYWDPAQDPEFPDHAQRYGSLDRPAENAPLWVAPTGQKFLVLSPFVRSVADLIDRVRELTGGEGMQRYSGFGLRAARSHKGTPQSGTA